MESLDAVTNRFFRYVAMPAAPTACWNWTGSKHRQGYGNFRPANVITSRLAHRFSYTVAVGPVPAGLELDHLCRNVACVNPLHLEPVTKQENIRRGLAGENQRVKTHCPQGHPYAGDNLYLQPGTRRPGFGRICRECSRVANLRHYQKRYAPQGDVADFLAQVVVLTPGARLSAPDLRLAYEAWCVQSTVPPATRKRWGQLLLSILGPYRRSMGGRYYADLSVHQSTERAS